MVLDGGVDSTQAVVRVRPFHLCFLIIHHSVAHQQVLDRSCSIGPISYLVALHISTLCSVRSAALKNTAGSHRRLGIVEDIFNVFLRLSLLKSLSQVT